MNYANVFKKEEKTLEQQRQEELKKYGLDEESIKEFRSKIKKVSYEESQRLGSELFNGLTVLYLDKQNVDEYILSGADVNYFDTLIGISLLQILNLSSSSILISLIKAGANIDAKDRYGETAVMRYACFNNYEYLKILVLMGADLNIKNNNGNTALDIAIESGNTQCIKILKDAMELNNWYNEYNNIENKKQEYLKKYGLDLESIKEFRSKINHNEFKNESDFYDLINAIENNDIIKAEKLIIEGININMKFIKEERKGISGTIKDVSLLNCAIEEKNLDMAILLLKAGYEIKINDMKDALYSDMYELCKIMILMGIDLKETMMPFDETILDVARFSKQEKYIKLFENAIKGDYSVILDEDKEKDKPKTKSEIIQTGIEEMEKMIESCEGLLGEDYQKKLKK